MIGTNDFYTELKAVSRHNQVREYNRLLRLELTGESVYIDFCIYCNCYSVDREDVNYFSSYLDENNIQLTFWQKKYLLENHFGYSFDYDYENQKWKIKKGAI